MMKRSDDAPLPPAGTSRYAVITAGKNEAAYLPALINAIVSQSITPVKWIIVDDNSSDATYELAVAASKKHPFIEVRKSTPSKERSFSSQVFAQQEGFAGVRDLDVEFVGFLDADIGLPPDYYEEMIHHFRDNSSLALVGGLVVDKLGNHFSRHRARSIDHHVPGGVQFFRKSCYIEIGGYRPIEGGGQDTMIEIMCLMRGWKIQTFLTPEAIHLRPTDSSTFRASFRWGQMCYNLGYHPLYYFSNTLARFLRDWSFKIFWGQTYSFFYATVTAKRRPVSKEFIRYMRQLQINKIRTKILCK